MIVVSIIYFYITWFNEISIMYIKYMDYCKNTKYLLTIYIYIIDSYSLVTIKIYSLPLF